MLEKSKKRWKHPSTGTWVVDLMLRQDSGKNYATYGNVFMEAKAQDSSRNGSGMNYSDSQSVNQNNLMQSAGCQPCNQLVGECNKPEVRALKTWAVEACGNIRNVTVPWFPFVFSKQILFEFASKMIWTPIAGRLLQPHCQIPEERR